MRKRWRRARSTPISSAASCRSDANITATDALAALASRSSGVDRRGRWGAGLPLGQTSSIEYALHLEQRQIRQRSINLDLTIQRDHGASRHLRHASFVDPFAGLRSGEIDILVTWLPVEEPDLSVGPILFKDRRVLAVAADHELAPRASASVEDIAFHQHSGARRTPDYWEDSFIPFHTPRGRTIERGPLVTNMDELLSGQ
ncbi:LysR substrate-binding domain-containing protein [Nonomuraea sp. NPDC050680]|uniref:LysR substrate-binding domain-containing protein n=1 Tax=Nonomuraea sp. NPDC050680 TaxID=3154630 RepID=UPI0033F4B73F